MSDTERMAVALERIVALLEGAGYKVGGTVPSGPGPTPHPGETFVPASTPVTVGLCPVHNTPWRTTKKDGTPSKRAYCSGKLDNGDYCNQQGPWL